MEIEEFRIIPDFSKYAVSNLGRVIHIDKNREMTLSPTEKGDLTVGLMGNGNQYRRSVKVLVAKAFVTGRSMMFDTPIQLDGDRENLKATNIVWRPRWFAWHYSRQFVDIPAWVYSGPIVNTLGYEYETIIDAGIQTGSLWRDIRWSIAHGREVFPYGVVYYYK